MHIDPNNSGNLPHLSPIFSSNNLSPYLSPLLESSHRKPSNDEIDLLNFRLERDDEDYPNHH